MSLSFGNIVNKVHSFAFYFDMLTKFFCIPTFITMQRSILTLKGNPKMLQHVVGMKVSQSNPTFNFNREINLHEPIIINNYASSFQKQLCYCIMLGS